MVALSYYYLLLLTGTGLLLGWAPNLSVRLRLWSLAVLWGAFTLAYRYVDDQVAQDRGGYYDWYRSSAELLRDEGARDKLFTLLLNWFPVDLSAGGFFVAFSVLIFGVFLLLLVGLARLQVLTWDKVPLIAVASLCDRLFLDMTLNASRSSLAALTLLLGLTLERRWSRAAICLVAFGIHGRVVLLLAASYLLWWTLRRAPQAWRWLTWIGLALFALRAVTGATLLPAIQGIDVVLQATESESVSRGITLSTGMTNSLAGQIALGVALPLLIVLWRGFPICRTMAIRYYGHLGARSDALGWGISSAVVFLVLYPDFALVQRLLIAVVPLLLVGVDIVGLRWLTLMKFVLMMVVLQNHMT